MGILPVAALDGAARYASDVLTDPLAMALAALLAVLTVAGLCLLGAAYDETGPSDGPASWLRRRLLRQPPRPALAAELPRLPQRLPHTRSPRPADAPAVAACGLLRGPPGPDSRPTRADSGEGHRPR